jgi:hypothetical protein
MSPTISLFSYLTTERTTGASFPVGVEPKLQ